MFEQNVDILGTFLPYVAQSVHRCWKWSPKGAFPSQKLVQVGLNFGPFLSNLHQKAAKVVQKEGPWAKLWLFENNKKL